MSEGSTRGKMLMCVDALEALPALCAALVCTVGLSDG